MVIEMKTFEALGLGVACCVIAFHYQLKWLPITLPIAIILNKIPVIFISMGLALGLALVLALVGRVFDVLGYLEEE